MVDNDLLVNYSKLSVTNGTYPVNTTASFTCDGVVFNLTGAVLFTCQTSGTWNKETPECIRCKDYQR